MSEKSESSNQLRAIISELPGKKWDDKVGELAMTADRTKSTVYKWLSDTPSIPTLSLDGIRYRLQPKLIEIETDFNPGIPLNAPCLKAGE